MAFHSAAFLFFYIPVIFLFYLVIPGPRAKNVYLTIAGLIFYACGQWQGVPVLVLSALLAWLAGRSGRKGVLALTLVCQVAMLGLFKYLDFFTGTLNDLLGLNIPAANLLLPIGVSFFTFKAMAYTIDAYRDGGTSRRFLDVLLYLSFFPQVVSGPIERYGQFAENLEDRPLNAVQMAHGLRRFIIGFAKKALLSETAALAANGAFGLEAGLDFRLAWLGAFAYTIQIYFDFSGYSDMAIGLGELFGFRTPENFDYPYISASITEFWRRWHISLSFWFRDYLYIPLGGGRCGKLRKCLNKCSVFLLCGLWHGASWTFVLWGAWHGLFSVLESALPQRPSTGFRRILGHVYTLLVVCIGFVLFRASDLGEASRMLQAMFTPGISAPSTFVLEQMAPSVWLALAAGAAGSMPVIPWLRKRLPERLSDGAAYLCALGLMALCLLAAAGSGFQPFIYTQF